MANPEGINPIEEYQKLDGGSEILAGFTEAQNEKLSEENTASYYGLI